MNVTLISSNYDAIDLINKMYCAARTCYCADSTMQIRIDADSVGFDEKLDFVKKVLKSGHHSIAEHITFTYGIDGISRSCSHQLVRHRLCTFSQQSQRYTSPSKENKINWIIPDSIKKDEYALVYFEDAIKAIEKAYNYCVDIGIKKEDARFILPNACPTNITVSTNLRNLMHVMGLRLCNRAQWEIRKVFEEMKAVTISRYAWLDDLLQPQCVHLGYCPEHNSCKKYPPKEELIKVYKESLK